MFERPHSGFRAVLVHVEFARDRDREDRAEFRELSRSAGASCVGWVGGRRETPDPRYFVGQGKATEICDRVRDTGADLVIFNHALSPRQERNLEGLLECRVVDRIGLILDIFAQRASSFEGKLQVELAQLRHLSTRLVRGWTHLERQKGGIGLRGPGEKQLETDRRLLAQRIKQINRRLEGVGRRRRLARKSRDKTTTPIVSVVGYTNAGKSTLFNRLTGANVSTADRPFATLDPTIRRMENGGEPTAVVVDTVGFIRHLPHDLVAAFRATLEETRRAGLLLNVVDRSAPDRDARLEQVNLVLRELGTEEIPRILVYNKIDRLADSAPRMERDRSGQIARIWLSAETGAGMELLVQALRERLDRPTVRRWVHLPVDESRLRARLFELGTVVEERLNGDRELVLEVDIWPAHLERLMAREGLRREIVFSD